MYDHNVDQRGNKWSSKNKLSKIVISELPDYINLNADKYKEWLD